MKEYSRPQDDMLRDMLAAEDGSLDDKKPDEGKKGKKGKEDEARIP